MPIADSKKAQTFINIAAAEVAKLQASATRLAALRTAWQSHSPDATGTPLDGNVVAVSNWIDDVISASNNAVANGLVAHVVSSHRSKAMGDI